MSEFFPGLIVGFREGLEAFLIVAIALRFLEKLGKPELKRGVFIGSGIGAVVSLLFGLVLFAFSNVLGGAGNAGKIWEVIASLAAMALVSTFIVWMIRHGSEIKGAVESRLGTQLTASGVSLMIAAMVLREGVEIVLFSFAGTYPPLSLFIGIMAALVLVAMVFYSLVKFSLSAIFNLTLAYLILQAGFLLGYGLHEALSALKNSGALEATHPILIKAFDLSSTAFNHKTGWLGIPLYALVGWYSKPEWLQFIVQYLYTGLMVAYWLALRYGKKKSTLSR